MVEVGDASQEYVLGIDLGSASIGWAVIGLDAKLEPCKVLGAGSHIFDPGVQPPPNLKISNDDAILRGVDRSKAVTRRIARQTRRQLSRRRARQKALFRLLQLNHLLPTYPEFEGEPLAAERHHTFNRLDNELSDMLCKPSRKRGMGAVLLEADQALPYVLRKDALERELTLHEFGRVLYHLCQRRGYRPSSVDDSEEVGAAPAEETAASRRGRKKRFDADSESGKDKESPKKVEAGISDLDVKMQAAHAAGIIKAPLIGPYFGTFTAHDPHKERIRHRWTGREMFEKEFDLIWEKQREYHRVSHDGLWKNDQQTDELRKQIRKLLFVQRPLASAEHLIGFCDLEPTERRAPWASLEAQRFRLLQKVNNLKWFSCEELREQPLTEDQRKRLVDELQQKGDLSFAAIRKLLNMPDAEFNLQKPKLDEEGKKKKKHDEGKIEGNRVNKVMLEAFGPDRWNAFSPEEQSVIVEVWRKTEGIEERKKVATERWGFDPAHARIWAENRPPGDYCKHSRKAILNLLEKMETGISYATAKTAIYGNPLAGKKPLPFVPRVTGGGGFLPSLTNPPVIRALTELRKVVNAIIRQFGGVKPYEIRIELARELRKNRKQRHDATVANEKQHQRRLEAARKILEECHNYQHRELSAKELVDDHGSDVTKMLLLMECHMECGGFCPYTGDPISFQQLFGGEVEFEHIIPQSMMVDNSFDNLTLSFRKTNLEKLNKTPWMAFGGPGKEGDWPGILDRVRKFGNPRKLHLFQLRSPEEARAFGSRRLNDTRYTSKLAGRLLMSLYGGRDVAAETADELDEFKDRTGRRAIFVSSGMVTSLLRDAWCLNLSEVIGEDAYKSPECEDDSRTARRTRRNESKKKDRSDHRHHALDAVVIALTTENLVQKINTLASQFYDRQRDGSYRPLTYRELMKEVRRGGWPDLLSRENLEGVRKLFREMIASHRPEHKLSGELHKAGFFGKERGESRNGTPIRHRRVAIKSLSEMKTDAEIEKTIDRIVDGTNGRIQGIVREFGQKIGGFRKWSGKEFPELPNRKTGRPVPIKKFTVWITKNTKPLGSEEDARRFGGDTVHNGHPERNVEEGEIAYVSFFMVQGRKGAEWKWDIVKLFDAAQRVRSLPKAERGLRRISETLPNFPDSIFRFSLMKGDLIELIDDGKPGIFVARRFEGDGRVWVAPINAAGTDEDLKKAGRLRRIGIAEFLRMGAGEDGVPQPVFVDLLGRPHKINIGA